MNTENLAKSLAAGHDTVYLVKLKVPDVEDPALGEDGSLFTILSMARKDVTFEHAIDTLEKDYGVEVEWLYPITSVDALARASLGDKVYDLIREKMDADPEGT